MGEEMNQKEKRSKSLLRELVSWAIPILVAVLAALLLKNYVVINAHVPSDSMQNTIQVGDDLFGLRLAYKTADPKRGDIIIFHYPDNPAELYIKRIIGLPGEKVSVRAAKVYIDDSTEPLQEDYLKEEWTEDNDGYSFSVPEGHYLVFGDNRNESWDSRFWDNTYVSRDSIVGKAWVLYYPFKHFKFF